MKTFAIIMVALSCLTVGEAAFVSSPVNRAPMMTRDVSQQMKLGSDNLESRRSMLQNFSLATLGIASGFVSQAAHGSGGATAGGAYLLSAKQRYNERVTKAAKNFLALGPKLEADSLAEANEYFACNEPGCWLDFSTAGYLLANAFRRSANTNPDSLPAVKAWKAYAKAVGGVEKSLKKNKASVTLEAYKTAEAKLDAYLEEVELPPSIEMRK